IDDIGKHVDYHGWLNSRKRNWRQVRERRKRQRLENLDTSHKRNGLGSYFERQELALTRSHWQILQLVPSSQNGQLFAWVIVDGIRFLLTFPEYFTLIRKLQFPKDFLEEL
ncbi:DNA polymerase epsilon catalytic subunit A-like protein, partial [Tanacetum coccineum]